MPQNLLTIMRNMSCATLEVGREEGTTSGHNRFHSLSLSIHFNLIWCPICFPMYIFPSSLFNPNFSDLGATLTSPAHLSAVPSWNLFQGLCPPTCPNCCLKTSPDTFLPATATVCYPAYTLLHPAQPAQISKCNKAGYFACQNIWKAIKRIWQWRKTFPLMQKYQVVNSVQR